MIGIVVYTSGVYIRLLSHDMRNTVSVSSLYSFRLRISTAVYELCVYSFDTFKLNF